MSQHCTSMSRHWSANVATLITFVDVATLIIDVTTLIVDVTTLNFSLLSLDVDVATLT